MPETFFDRNTLMTLPGCVLIVQVVCNSLQAVFKFNPKWLALFLSIGLCIFGIFLSQNQQPFDFFLGVLNGFLVFSSAAGINEMANLRIRSSETERGGIRSRELKEGEKTKSQHFFSSWLSKK